MTSSQLAPADETARNVEEPLGPAGMTALRTERKEHQRTKRRYREAAAEVARLQIQIVRLAAINGREERLKAALEQRDRIIKTLREQLQDKDTE